MADRGWEREAGDRRKTGKKRTENAGVARVAGRGNGRTGYEPSKCVMSPRQSPHHQRLLLAQRRINSTTMAASRSFTLILVALVAAMATAFVPGNAASRGSGELFWISFSARRFNGGFLCLLCAEMRRWQQLRKLCAFI